MSRYGSDRDESRKYEADVYYEAWRRGLDPEQAVQCAEDCRIQGRYPDECVDDQARAERRRHEAREYQAHIEQEMERQYYEAMEQQRYAQDEESQTPTTSAQDGK